MKTSLHRFTRLHSLLALTTLALTCAGGMRAAQAADNANATATAVVLQPIAVAKFADLVFGNVVAGNGVVTLATDGSRVQNGATALPTGVAGAAARFDVTGSANNTFAIDTTTSDATLSDGGGNTMAVDWITEVVATTTPSGKSDATTDVTTGTLSGGAAYIFVGGKLTVGAAQPAATYTGTIRVIVAYN